MALKKRKTSPSPVVTVENLKEETSKLSVPSGSTLLNLACSDSLDGAYGTGKIVNLIGDSSSGKTILAWSMLAEVINNPLFKEYRIIYDDVEAALEINIKKMFGKKTKERVEFLSSDTVEEFYGTIVSITNNTSPFIYVLDSLDALTCDEEQKRAEEYAKEKGNKAGSFKTEKPRMISEILRVMKRKIKSTHSMLLIISQTRDNIGFSSMFQPKTRSGGKGLKFYCSHEIWLAVGKKHKKMEREIGADVMVKITKNKLTGKKRNIEFPVYYDYGVDDIGSCVKFLMEEKHWKKSGNNIDAHDLNLLLTENKLIDEIESKNLEPKLRKIVQSVWTDIEDKIKMDRKPKYEE